MVSRTLRFLDFIVLAHLRGVKPSVDDIDTPGHVDLLIKMYATGKMGQYLKNLKPGDSIEMKGPWKKIDYKPNMKKTISMIAGGSGITPMYQVLAISDGRPYASI